MGENLGSGYQTGYNIFNDYGAIVENNQKLMGIHAYIRGAGFYSPEAAAVQTEGHFYGTNAESVGGVFLEKASGQYGSFGASKQ